jgi:hypothetical protein
MKGWRPKKGLESLLFYINKYRSRRRHIGEPVHGEMCSSGEKGT